ncbi:MAG: hypothetical protein AAFQ98_13565 [Bacteroidota bacterium]
MSNKHVVSRWAAAVAVAGLITFSACDQAVEMESQSTDEETALDEAAVESEVEELFRNSQEAMDVTSEGGRQLEESYCATRTVDRQNQTITLDFGTEGCVGADGRTRSGVIVITYEGTLIRSRLAARTMTFDNYKVEGRTVSGSFNISGASQNTDGHWEFTRTVTDMVMTFSDGRTFTYSNTKTLTWTEGFGDTEYFNDTFEVTGSGSGVNREGMAFTVSIDEPLVRKTECTGNSGRGFPVSGVKSYSATSDGETRSFSVDYGDGTCDRTVEVSFADGTTRTVEVDR